MRLATALPVALAFAAGALLSPLAQHFVPPAHAQASAPAAAAPGLTAAIIDVAALKDADLAATPNPDLRSKGFVTTPNATIAVQMGNLAKHFHSNTDEIQYIVEGTGTAWLGNEKREIRPGMMIVIPRGTHHAGTEAISGRFKAIVIKIPPQDPNDTTFVN
ncbi:MAG TPA: cupin domain-containing protein [Burkholderiaceae bacterium]|nr:cupin domain-containing protein [Burkholderiaceae bacterium]